jgi:hypothetical protein
VSLTKGRRHEQWWHEREQDHPRRRIKDVDSETSGGFVTIRGRACNDGSEPATFVKIGCDYLNSEGQVVNSDFTYASSSSGIQPGACKEFTLMERNSNDWKQYRTYVMTD